MDFLVPLIKIIHLIVSVILILIILVQPSKSGDIGSMFGGGTSESVFGSVGAVPFLVKLTRLFAFVFIVTSLSLGYFSVKSIKSSVVDDSVIEVPAPADNQNGQAGAAGEGTGQEIMEESFDDNSTEPEMETGSAVDDTGAAPESEKLP